MRILQRNVGLDTAQELKIARVGETDLQIKLTFPGF